MRPVLFSLVTILSVVVVTAGDARSPAPSQLIVFASNRGPNVENGEIFSVRLDGTRRRDLSRSQGSDFAPVPSPNGRRIAFPSVRFESGSWVYGLYVMRADGTGQRRLTPRSVQVVGDAHPTWSPDGSKLAFTAAGDSGSGVYVMRVDGSGLRLIARGGLTPVWAPSGNRIAFVSYEVGDPRQRTRIAIVREDGGDPVLLTDDHDDSQPAWSPDGSVLAFVRNDELHRADLFTIDSSGGPIREVLSRTIPIGKVAWVGRDRLVFDSGGIWTVSSAGSGPRRVVAGTSPALSPDRKRIAYVRGRSIAVVGSDGRRIRTVLRIPREHVYDGPFWIAGGRLAFSSEAAGANDYDLWVADARGGRVRQLTNTPVNEGLPVWSPDHRRLAFVRSKSLARFGSIWVSDATAANARRIAFGGSPSWSPDGRRLAFSSRRVIYSIAVDGGRPQRVVSGESPSWSPRGRKIAFVRKARVLVVDLGTHAVQTLIDFDRVLDCEDEGATVTVPEWSPDGKELAVIGECDRGRSGSGAVVLVSADGSRSRQIVINARLGSRPAWSPGGDRLAFETYVNAWRLVTVLPDGSSSRTVTWSRADDRDPDW